MNRSRAGSFWLSLKIGALLTRADIGAAKLASAAGKEGLASFLFWPNTLLQGLLPCVPIGAANHRVCEGTPLNFVAYVASILISVALYTLAAFVLTRRRARGL
jgi:hypothetical protein